MPRKPSKAIVVLSSNLYTSRGKALRGEVVPLPQTEIDDLAAMDRDAEREQRFTVIDVPQGAADEDR